ncbi:MAG: GMC family oxidoreductase [Acidobacteria bacterium]|nr:GMC family oxidoreductase [Acidobacteriota bacterium]
MPQPVYDVCVIGGGASGGTVAGTLARAGVDVVLVEGGPYRNPALLKNHAWPYDQTKPTVPPVGVDPKLEPIEMHGDSIGINRARVLGGRTTHWNAVALRFSEADFRERSRNGIEDDWPVPYAEFAPYYDRAERLMVVCGTRENLEVLPDGQFIPPLKPRCSERILGRACEKLGIRMIPVRKALATEPGHGRAACHFCGHCMSGCEVSAIFNTAEHVIPAAQKTGRLRVVSNCMARQLLMGTGENAGRARAVSVLHRDTKREEEIQARVFVLSCGNIESARLWLNSRFPNTYDNIGRYLHGHITCSAMGYLSALVGKPMGNQDGATDHVYIPRMKRPRCDYAGGFGFQLNFASYMTPYHAKHLPGYGAAFKRRVRELQPGYTHLGGFGKGVSHRENRITVHATRRDAYGIPIPVVYFHWQPNDRALFKDMCDTALEIYDAAGVKFLIPPDPVSGGFASHEVGAMRMGSDPKTSVVNRLCQAHEVKNVFVTDGSCFTTFPEKNPTLTIVALSIRTADNIVELRRRGEL